MEHGRFGGIPSSNLGGMGLYLMLAALAPDALNVVRSPLCPATPRNGGKAGQAHAEQRDGCRFGHRGGQFGDDDLAVAGLKIGNQDLVYAGIEGATTATWVSQPEAATMDEGAATTAIASAPTAGANARRGTANIARASARERGYISE